MNKKDLEQYVNLKREITYLEKKINKLEQKSTITSDYVQTGFIGKRKKVSTIVGIDEKQQKRLSKYKTRLQSFKLQLDQKRVELEEFIEQIDDTELRLIIRYRYEDDFSWIKIMHLMKYNNESTARMKVDRFLEKIL